MRGDSMVNVDPSSLVITVPGAVYSALFIRTVASRMFSTGALDSFLLPFLVMSLPTVMDVISYLNLWRERRPRSVAENPGSKCGSRAWDQETELQICGKSPSGSQAGRRYAWRQSSWGGYDLA